MVKRAMDIVFAALGLAVLSPFFLLICIFIVLDSPGRPFYLQERIGRNFIPFRLIKFRTMRTGADRLNSITVGARDPRITRVGYWLRRFKIDELPQLVNVLVGNMSLVGPRPELKKFVDLYTPAQQRVLSIKPGITDFASIQFRNENELLEGKPDPIGYYTNEIMPAKLQLNLRYLESQSIALDMRIIFSTLFLIFKK
jgi:lipopolysaccharide/colanic/teichoic acid biosynthesis glycosyltransferase